MGAITKRVSESGEITYRARIRLRGLPLVSATFTSKSKAKEWMQLTEAAIREGRYFKHAESKKHTLNDLVDRYIRHVLPTKPKSLVKQTAQLLWWKAQIGKHLLSDVTPALIVEYRDKLSQGITARDSKRAPATVVRYLAALSHAFSTAVKEWGWLDDSPMRKVTRPKEPRGRIRFLNDNERKFLLEACQKSDHAHLYTIVVLALSTGMRQGEIMHLTWDDVDFATNRIVLHDTKNGESRVLPLVGHARELLVQLSKLRRLDTRLLFPGKNTKKPLDLRYAWEQAIKIAGIEDFRFHDLRHSAASYLAMNKATLGEIAHVLGHKTLQMVKRYAHHSEAHTTKVVTQMNSNIFTDILDDQKVINIV
ncbi:MAG: site-specific integrase [Verrucomicrobia bacterium]|nr:site-specific integrase [Verrucomicrobiota bacterium]